MKNYLIKTALIILLICSCKEKEMIQNSKYVPKMNKCQQDSVIVEINYILNPRAGDSLCCTGDKEKRFIILDKNYFYKQVDEMIQKLDCFYYDSLNKCYYYHIYSYEPSFGYIYNIWGGKIYQKNDSIKVIPFFDSSDNSDSDIKIVLEGRRLFEDMIQGKYLENKENVLPNPIFLHKNH